VVEHGRSSFLFPAADVEKLAVLSFWQATRTSVGAAAAKRVESKSTLIATLRRCSRLYRASRPASQYQACL
jgi:hypothetical protein